MGINPTLLEGLTTTNLFRQRLISCNSGSHVSLLLQPPRLKFSQLGVVDERVLQRELGVVRPVHHLQDDASDPALQMNLQ